MKGHSSSNEIMARQTRELAATLNFERKWLLQYGTDWQHVHDVCHIHTIADFWGLFNNVGMPTNSPVKCDYYMFHSGIEPKWEAPENKGGGKWNVNLGLDRAKADPIWMNILMILVGEQLEGDVVNGVSLHLRPRGLRCSLWTRGNVSDASLLVLGKSLRELSALPAELEIEFKRNEDSIVSGNSFMSTCVMTV